MTPNPILKVLSSMRANGVACLLMGGQACVLYGAAEFSRDADFVVLADSENLSRLQFALNELQAARIAVPPFESRYLEMGLAVHFRCQHPDAARIRIDVMSKLRGVDEFGDLWARRTTIETSAGEIDLLALPDLVRTKKTQRDKDWPMLARLVEANYFENQDDPSPEQIDFWLCELRSPSLLLQVTRRFRERSQVIADRRPLLRNTDEATLFQALRAEEDAERDADRQYWLPLKKELECLRNAEQTTNLFSENR